MPREALVCSPLTSHTNIIGDTLFKRPVSVIIKSMDGSTHPYQVAGRSGNDLLVFENPGPPDKLERIPFNSIEYIRARRQKPVQTILISLGIGLLPLVAGQGGAYVALATFPISLIVGIVLAGSKRKYSVHGRFDSFRRFTDRYMK